MKNLEHQEQTVFFRWAKLNERKYPELALLFAIPNGGARHIAVARKLKAEGVKAGVPDIFLPASQQWGGGCDKGFCRSYHGLFIELKAGKNKPTTTQAWWHRNLIEAGYKVEVCYSWQEACKEIVAYLNGGRGEAGA